MCDWELPKFLRCQLWDGHCDCQCPWFRFSVFCGSDYHILHQMQVRHYTFLFTDRSGYFIKVFSLYNKWYIRGLLFSQKSEFKLVILSYFFAVKFVNVLFWQIYTVTPLVQRTGPVSEMEVLAHEAVGPRQYVYGDERK